MTWNGKAISKVMGWGMCEGNPNSLDEQLFSQDLVRGNPK
jgi:hypothetical protein